MGSRPSLGYPGDKYEMGLEAIEEIEVIAAALAAEVFEAKFAEIRVPSGAIGPRDNNNNNDLLPRHSLVQPPNVEIDYQKFESEYLVHAISIDRTKVSKATKILRGFTLEERGIQDVVLDETDPEKRKRLIWWRYVANVWRCRVSWQSLRLRWRVI